ncbi:MAG: replicative DNA helicase [Spirochaetales bacterium]|nr:replicative DNA helicase [Spirochaetales bacterium]
MEFSSLKDNVPPHNDDAEKASLGAVLLDQEAVDSVLRFLRADDFYRTSHKKIFQAIVDLSNQSQPIDLITLAEKLRDKGELEMCGGAAYISTLSDFVPTSANVEYYAKIVREQSVRRQLIKTASEMISWAHDDTREGNEIIEEAEKKIFEITDSNTNTTYKNAGEIVEKTINDIERLYKKKEAYTGVPSGFSDLDQMTSGFQNSEFIIIGARPSIGKTALALTMASNMAIHQKISVGFFSLEMSDMALMQRVVASESRINSGALRSGMFKMSDFSKLMEAASRIYEAPLFVDDTPNMKLLQIRSTARRLKAQEDIKIMFIDYIGLIEPENKGRTPRHEQIGEISRSLKALARELQIPIVCLSQVGRQAEGEAPKLSDLRESGSIEQDADVVMFLHRDRMPKEEDGNQGAGRETKLIVAKQRNGPTGNVELVFIPQYTRFESHSKEF